MTERLHSIPVQQMPDFHTALDVYGKFLGSVGADPESINRNVEKIVANNKTRQQGNQFINHVNQVARGLLAK